MPLVNLLRGEPKDGSGFGLGFGRLSLAPSARRLQLLPQRSTPRPADP